MEKSVFDEITSALTVQSLCSRLGPDIPSGSPISDLEEILIDAEVDPMNCPSRIIDADGNVKGVLWYENWSSVDEMGEGPGIVDEVAERLEPNEFLSSDTNVLDAVNIFAAKDNRYFYVIWRNEIVGVLFYNDLFKPLGRLAFLALALEIEDLALRLCQAASVIEDCWQSIPENRRRKAAELFKSRHNRDPNPGESASKKGLASFIQQGRIISDLGLLIECTNIVDKATMIWKRRLISGATRAEVLGLFNDLKEVRDQCAHPGGGQRDLIPKAHLAHFVNSAKRMRDGLRLAIEKTGASVVG
jgi:hypothetical protein